MIFICLKCIFRSTNTFMYSYHKTLNCRKLLKTLLCVALRCSEQHYNELQKIVKSHYAVCWTVLKDASLIWKKLSNLTMKYTAFLKTTLNFRKVLQLTMQHTALYWTLHWIENCKIVGCTVRTTVVHSTTLNSRELLQVTMQCAERY